MPLMYRINMLIKNEKTQKKKLKKKKSDTLSQNKETKTKKSSVTDN